MITFRCCAMATCQHVRGIGIGNGACLVMFRMHAHASPHVRWGPLPCHPFYLQTAIFQPPRFVSNHPPSHSHLGHKFKDPSFWPQLKTFSQSFVFPSFLCTPNLPPYDLEWPPNPMITSLSATTVQGLWS